MVGGNKKKLQRRWKTKLEEEETSSIRMYDVSHLVTYCL